MCVDVDAGVVPAEVVDEFMSELLWLHNFIEAVCYQYARRGVRRGARSKGAESNGSGKRVPVKVDVDAMMGALREVSKVLRKVPAPGE